MRALNAKSRGLKYDISRSGDSDDEISFFDVKTRKTPRFAIFLDKMECTCSQWQISGKPCLHAIAFICYMRNSKMESYVDDYLSVEKFKMAYQTSITPMTDKTQWTKVDPGFNMLPPKLGRSAGRPRKKRIPNSAEGGSKKVKQCARCKQFGHHTNKCKEAEWEEPKEMPTPAPKTKKRNTKAVGASHPLLSHYLGQLLQERLASMLILLQSHSLLSQLPEKLLQGKNKI